jgi:hypothetical protein
MFFQRLASASISYRTAPNPWGPWSDSADLPGYSEAVFGYSAQAHDEFSQQNGKVMYLTYTSGGIGQGISELKVTFQ